MTGATAHFFALAIAPPLQVGSMYILWRSITPLILTEQMQVTLWLYGEHGPSIFPSVFSAFICC